MTRLKRVFAILLVAVMTLTLLAGCGKIPDPSTWDIKNGVLIVPEGVTRLSKQQIEKVSGNFTSVILPASLTSIGDSAFEGNTALESVTFDAGDDTQLTPAGWMNFTSVAAAINIPACEAENTYIIPASLTSIGAQGSTVLKSITEATASNYTKLNSTAGWMNFAVAAAANAHKSRAAGNCSIGKKAFYGCTSLTTITGWSHIVSIGSSAFQNTNISGKIDLSNVTSIGASAFEGCTGIRGSLDLSSVVSIGVNAFKGCIEITVVIIPSEADVGDNAFSANVTINIGTGNNTDNGNGGTVTDPDDNDDGEGEIETPSDPVDQSKVETQLRNWLAGAGCSIELDTAFENDIASLTKQIAGAPSTYILPGASQTESFKKLLAEFQSLCLNFYKSYSSNVQAGDFMIPVVLSGDLTEDQVVATTQSYSAPSENIQESVNDAKKMGYTTYVICYADYAVNATDPKDSAWVVYLAMYGVQDKVDEPTVERCADLEAYATKVLNDNQITPLDTTTQTLFATHAEKYALEIFNNYDDYGTLASEWTKTCANTVDADLSRFHIISLRHKGTNPSQKIAEETAESLTDLSDRNFTLTDFNYFVRVYKVSNADSYIYLLMALLYDVPENES